ncbi:hypothetical protein AYJ09_01550 [Candidatus Liberibacter solanacearum]|uniref:hypothetical protein n=1 Tax=Candidatus Liberibacter solanacearum TaxID=556287 RepID=UPI000978FDC7|nr:hypothetical protein [Candidatus Liberibacter solanacearum]ONI59093.1 hypothetical protein AYJ09_01550 [Candidatus Liberibacter solanacearum]
MGKVSQHFMEQIEENYEFNCLHNPRFEVVPEEAYEGEIRDWVKRLLENAQILEKNRDPNLQQVTLDLILYQLNHIRFLARNHRRRISATGESKDEDNDQDCGLDDWRWEEPDEVPTEHPDQEHADAYYANQI